MRGIRAYGWLVFFLCLGNLVAAQQASIQLDRDSILIGEQVEAVITIRYEISDSENQVIWPELKGELAPGIEIVKRSKIDTLANVDESNLMLFEQSLKLTVTSFDSGYFAITPLIFTVDGLPVESNAALLSSYYPDLEPEAQLADIKEIRTIQFTFADWFALFWYWVVAGFVILVGIIILIVWLRRRSNQSVAGIEEKVVVIPAHILAFQDLEKLEQKKLWQQEKHKEYYSELTTIFRAYLERRYGIRALEETSDEIATELKRKAIPVDHQEKIESLLTLADLVKFAKEKPLPRDHEQAMTATREFIDFSKQPNNE